VRVATSASLARCIDKSFMIRDERPKHEGQASGKAVQS